MGQDTTIEEPDSDGGLQGSLSEEVTIKLGSEAA